MKRLLLTVVVALTSQNALANAGLSDAFKAALQSAEIDHKSQQVAFDVDPDHVEKATFKKPHEQQIIKLETSMMTDSIINGAQPRLKDHSKEDFAGLRKELGDIK